MGTSTDHISKRTRARGPRTNEKTVNGALAATLARRNPRWAKKGIQVEATGILRGTDKNRAPDLLVPAQGKAAPVIVEMEFAPARTLEKDALARLGTQTTDGRTVEQVIALKAPQALQEGAGSDLTERIEALDQTEPYHCST